MTKKQFKTRQSEELLARFKALPGTNTENVEKAMRMWLDAQGLKSESGIEREIRQVDTDINDIRKAANEEIAEKQKRRDELTTMLEHRRSEQLSYDTIVAQIADEMAANPERTIEGFHSEMNDLLSRTGVTDSREDIIADIRTRARENGIEIRSNQLQSSVTANTPAVAADGAVEHEQTINTSRYDFGNDDE
ncbi:hypothetical protein [Haladaptatus sp. DFWS20]|uniref:hypothetical protein n=1 Tax=Haladaptatus sp. DFWS20 TaxID=3403467 RepID=UPI003EB7DF82